jgi:hypothetical protein
MQRIYRLSALLFAGLLGCSTAGASSQHFQTLLGRLVQAGVNKIVMAEVYHTASSPDLIQQIVRACTAVRPEMHLWIDAPLTKQYETINRLDCGARDGRLGSTEQLIHHWIISSVLRPRPIYDIVGLPFMVARFLDQNDYWSQVAAARTVHYYKFFFLKPERNDIVSFLKDRTLSVAKVGIHHALGSYDFDLEAIALPWMPPTDEMARITMGSNRDILRGSFNIFGRTKHSVLIVDHRSLVEVDRQNRQDVTLDNFQRILSMQTYYARQGHTVATLTLSPNASSTGFYSSLLFDSPDSYDITIVAPGLLRPLLHHMRDKNPDFLMQIIEP